MTLRKTADHSAGVHARLISCSGHGIDPRMPAVCTAAEQVRRSDPADLVTNSVSSKACCLRNRATEAARCLNRRDTVPIADNRQGQKLYGATRHVAMTRMLVLNLKTLHVLFEHADFFFLDKIIYY